jgi:mannose-6-phosphate isomerase-like protein (cupin superfamily)
MDIILKKAKDHIIHHSITCGAVIEILRRPDFSDLSVAVAIDIKKTTAHYHRKFTEIYFVLDGSMTLLLFDPENKKSWREHLVSNELCLIPPGVHHQIVESSEKNRLCIIATPAFDPEDEHISEFLT